MVPETYPLGWWIAENPMNFSKTPKAFLVLATHPAAVFQSLQKARHNIGASAYPHY